MKSICKINRTSLFRISENSLTDNEKTAMQNHILECKECAALIDFFNQEVEKSSLNQKLTASPFFYTNISAKLESSKPSVFSLQGLFVKRALVTFLFVTAIFISVLIGINLGTMNPMNSKVNNDNASIISSVEDSEYGKFTSADYYFYNQYLKLIENGNQTNENY